MKLRRIEGEVLKETRNKMEIKGIRKLNNQKEEGMGDKKEKQREVGKMRIKIEKKKTENYVDI